MNTPTRLLAVLLSCGALAAPGRASIPGNISERSRAGLVHVCGDEEPGDPDYVVCIEQANDDPEDLYTGSECVAASLPPDCVIDFVPKVRLKARLTLAQDDAALDGGGIPNPNTEAAIVLEIKKGTKKATFFDLFDGSKMGNWNAFAETLLPNEGSGIDFDNDEHTAFQFANGNLTDLGLEIRDQAALWFPNADLVNAIPVLTAIERDTKRKPLDEDEFEQKLASAAFFKIVIEFARARP